MSITISGSVHYLKYLQLRQHTVASCNAKQYNYISYMVVVISVIIIENNYVPYIIKQFEKWTVFIYKKAILSFITNIPMHQMILRVI